MAFFSRECCPKNTHKKSDERNHNFDFREPLRMVSRSGRSISNQFLAFRQKPLKYLNMSADFANMSDEGSPRDGNDHNAALVNTIRAIEEWNEKNYSGRKTNLQFNI